MMKFDRRNVLKGSVAAFAVTAFTSILPYQTVAKARTPKNHIIEIQDFDFDPVSVNVQPGDMITWINRDIAPHTATASDKSWDTGTLKRGQSKTIKFMNNMTNTYFCRFHPHMKAQITIVGEPKISKSKG
ncbi:MAG: plastocyanin/azurin family copper-binding protein [Sneathiella sp.]